MGGSRCYGAGMRAAPTLIWAVTSMSAFATEQTAYEFDILRNGATVGQHEVRVSRGDDQTTASVRSEITVRFLGFTVYSMSYRSEEIWDRLGLKVLTVDIDDDGRTGQIHGRRRGTHFHWTSPDGRELSQPLPVYPTNHWNPDILGASTVLNTLTGKSNRVEVVADRDEAALPLPPASSVGDVIRHAYRYEGELNLHSWYDLNGRWLGMRFKGSDGSKIEYVCRNCTDRVAL